MVYLLLSRFIGTLKWFYTYVKSSIIRVATIANTPSVKSEMNGQNGVMSQNFLNDKDFCHMHKVVRQKLKI